jgi:hypothetical protein
VAKVRFAVNGKELLPHCKAATQMKIADFDLCLYQV